MAFIDKTKINSIFKENFNLNSVSTSRKTQKITNLRKAYQNSGKYLHHTNKMTEINKNCSLIILNINSVSFLIKIRRLTNWI